MEKNNSYNKNEQKNEYINVLYQIYSKILSNLNDMNDGISSCDFLNKDFEEYILQNLIGESNLNQNIKERLSNNFLEKLSIARNKQKNVLNFSNKNLIHLDDTIKQEQNEELKSILETIQYGNGHYILKGSILGIVTKKEQILNFMSENNNIDEISKIGFFIKDSYENYGFDIVIATDKDIIEHEYKESILELFSDEKIKKISIFNLENNLDKNYSKGEIFSGILSDILPHFASSNSSYHILQEIDQYQKYINYSLVNYNKDSVLYKALLDVNTFLGYLNKVINNINNSGVNNIQDKIYKGLIGNINYPHKLLSYLTDGNIDYDELNELKINIEQNIKKQDEIKSEIDYKIFNILSSNSLNIRYCTIITHIVKTTIIENTEEKNIKKIITPLNIENPNLEYILNLYLKTLKDTGKIKDFSGNIKDKMFIIDLNEKKNEIKIDSDGFLSFEVEITTISEQKIIIEEERTDEFWGDTTDSRLYRSLSKKEKSREVKDSKVIGEQRDGLTDNEIDDFSIGIEDLEKQVEERLDLEVSEANTEIDIELGDLMSGIDQEIIDQTDNIELSPEEEDLNQVYGYVFGLYETAVIDSINKLNEELKIQYKELDSNYEKYLYSQLKDLTLIKEDKKTIIKRLVFDRSYEIGSKSPDKVEIDIIYDKKTGEIKIKKDWQGMCSAHQVIDSSLEQILNYRWGINAKRIDQKETTPSIKQITKKKENTLKQ